MANLLAILCAKQRKFPECKENGILGYPKMILLTSEQAHYSIEKYAIVCGFGLKQVEKVKCD